MESKEYDSAEDTQKHILMVQCLMFEMVFALVDRSKHHDASKLLDPEKKLFDVMTPKLAALTYGSEEYKQALEDLKPALDHHYQANSHHPEHFEEGIEGMTLLDVVEMFCDWKAATLRHANGDLNRSFEHNEKRFSMAPQLVRIFENTKREMGW